MKFFKRQFLFLFLVIIIYLASSLLSYSQKAAKNLPPKEADAKAQLEKSSRHGEWITYTAENNDKVDAFVVYPERKDKAPVVIVIHEIFGLSDWVRAVADQFAAEGFIAIAPDLISGKAPGGKGSRGLSSDDARALIGALDNAEVIRRLNGAANYAINLPAAEKKYAVVGFCWGGGISFLYAAKQPNLSAAVLYYGVSPAIESLAQVNSPILGLYGGNDNRVNATIKSAEDELKRLKKSYEKEIYDGAGHAFLRQQDGMEGANMKATEGAWPRTIQFLKKAFSVNKKISQSDIVKTVALNNEKIDECCDEH